MASNDSGGVASIVRSQCTPKHFIVVHLERWITKKRDAQAVDTAPINNVISVGLYVIFILLPFTINEIIERRTNRQNARIRGRLRFGRQKKNGSIRHTVELCQQPQEDKRR